MRAKTQSVNRKAQNRSQGMVVAVMGLLLSIIWIARGAAVEAPATSAATFAAMRFVPVDVVLDSGANNLAAYQVEIAADAGTKIVGLEGGEHPAFRAAPYYDPAALPGNRIIVAAFSTSDSLPSGQTRVARLHLAITGGSETAPPQLIRKLVVATDAQGRSIPTMVSLRVSQGDRP